MSNEPTITVVGNITADPEIRIMPNGETVGNFTIANTPRRFDKDSNDWVNGDTMFLRTTVWGSVAENCAETLTKGMRVVATGTLRCENWVDNDGNNRVNWEMTADAVGPDMRFAYAQVTRNEPKGSGTVKASRRSNRGNK